MAAAPPPPPPPCGGGRGRSTWASSRWVPVLAGLLLEICGGSVYVTGLYAEDLKQRFFPGPGGQSRVEALVFACNLGNWLPAAGFFLDSPVGGARNTALVASALTLAGYGGLWAWSSGAVVGLAHWQVLALWFLWGHGSGWFDNAAVSTVARNFPLQRGRAIALVKAFYGLSGSILTQIYRIFFFERTSAYLLFLGVYLSLQGVLCAPLVYPVPPGAHGERDGPVRRLTTGLGIVVGLALFLLAATVARALWGAPPALEVVVFALMIVFLASLTVIARGTRGGSGRGGAVVEAEEEEVWATGVSGGGPAATAGLPPLLPDVSAREALYSAEFWLLFFVTFVGMGGGLIVMNHVGEMVKALGGADTLVSVLVSLVSIMNCLGRVAFGVVPDTFAGRVPRPTFLAANLVLMICGHLLLSVGFLGTLVAGSLLVGFSYGGFWTLMPTLVLELFGARSVSTLYNVQSLAVSSASFVFSTLLAAGLYDREAALHPAPSGNGCGGPHCYRTTFLAMAATSVAGVLAAAMLAQRVQRKARMLAEHSDLQRQLRLQ